MVKKDILRILKDLRPKDKKRLAEYLGLKSNTPIQQKKADKPPKDPKKDDDA